MNNTITSDYSIDGLYVEHHNIPEHNFGEYRVYSSGCNDGKRSSYVVISYVLDGEYSGMWYLDINGPNSSTYRLLCLDAIDDAIVHWVTANN